MLAFTSFEDGGSTVRLRVRERRPDGSLGPLSILSAENGNGGGPAAARGQRLGPGGRQLVRPADLRPAFDLVWVGTNFLL